MPTRKYIILLSGLFLGLFLLPFSAKAQEKILVEMLSSPAVTIAGYNVLCGFPENTTELTATTALPAVGFRWYEDGVEISGETTSTIIVSPTNPETLFSVVVLDASSDELGRAERRVFVTSRPIVLPANRVNDTLCTGENREAVVGIRNTTANYFVWGFDTLSSPHMMNDFCPIINNYRHHWNPPPTTDSINIHVWYQHPTTPQVVRTVFTVKMSTHPFSHPYLMRPYYQNRCFVIDSAVIEIDTVPLPLVASQMGVCVGNSITLNLSGDITDIVWSTGQTGGMSIPATISEIGDTTFSVEGVITFSPDRWCHGVGSVTVTGVPVPQISEIEVDGDFCEGSITRLTVVHSGGSLFSWWPTLEETESIEILPSGRVLYTVRVYGDASRNCYAMAEIDVQGINCEEIFFPTAIRLSTQIAGNNVWRPFLEPHEGTQYWFAIFNQWGQLIFESDDMSVGWDGTHNGQNVRPGTYVFLFRLTHIHRTWERTGTITVID